MERGLALSVHCGRVLVRGRGSSGSHRAACSPPPPQGQTDAPASQRAPKEAAERLCAPSRGGGGRDGVGRWEGWLQGHAGEDAGRTASVRGSGGRAAMVGWEAGRPAWRPARRPAGLGERQKSSRTFGFGLEFVEMAPFTLDGGTRARLGEQTSCGFPAPSARSGTPEAVGVGAGEHGRQRRPGRTDSDGKPESATVPVLTGLHGLHMHASRALCPRPPGSLGSPNRMTGPRQRQWAARPSMQLRTTVGTAPEEGRRHTSHPATSRLHGELAQGDLPLCRDS